jgi:hypothetical protein
LPKMALSGCPLELQMQVRGRGHDRQRLVER